MGLGQGREDSTRQPEHSGLGQDSLGLVYLREIETERCL